LRAFDGVIAVSDLDRSIFIEEYGIDPCRVLSLENGVDTAFYSDAGARDESPARRIVFVGSMDLAPYQLPAFPVLRQQSIISILTWNLCSYHTSISSLMLQT